MGASCSGPPGAEEEPVFSTRSSPLKPDRSIQLPLPPDEIKKRTISLAVPAPCLYRTRRYRFAGRSRSGYSGTTRVHVNQDNLLYYNFRRLDLHIFVILDGNGPDGDLAAFFVKEKLLMQFAQVMAEDVANEAAVATTLKRMFANVDEMLEEQEDIDVHNSGVTLVMAVLDENGVTIANCGDCRAIFGTQHPTKPRKLNVEALSEDHTLRVAAERQRCTATGAIIRCMAQLEGTMPLEPEPNWDLDLGTQLDLSGDPPRLFEEKLNPTEPAVAFSRAFGCCGAKMCGVISTPDVRRVDFSSDARFVVLGSNGVFEFITNQDLVKYAAPFHAAPATACDRILDIAYRVWWQMEKQIDDITIIIIAIDDIDPLEAEAMEEASGGGSASDRIAEDTEAVAAAAAAAATAEAGAATFDVEIVTEPS